MSASSESEPSVTETRRKRTRLIKQRDLSGAKSRHIVAGSAELLEEQLFGSSDAQGIAVVDREKLDIGAISDSGT
jgi:hypothetical protein